jgi:CheY-like chemotaxis protein/anti-sigma regulatory factor (Ser/Thr protein kinase)
MPRVLIVDDDPVHRDLAGRYLEGLNGLETRAATDGHDALRALGEQPADIVVTDLYMPSMDGLDLVGKIHEEFPGLPVVLMTSYGSEQLAVRALAAGAASYVPKSALKEDLLRTVRQVLELTRARRGDEQILEHLASSENAFALPNDTELITPLVAHFQDQLRALRYGDDSLRTQVAMALMEALSNAMIHGNLEIPSALRRDRPEEYHAMSKSRPDAAPYAARRVHVTALLSPERVSYVIRDEGPGFDPSLLPDPTLPENMTRVSGRGMLLIRAFMDRVEYSPGGNQITMEKNVLRSRS